MMRPTILAYHAIGDCPREQDPHNLFLPQRAFEEQMSYLARHKQVVALDDVTSGRARGRNCVAITFDDAYRNVARGALPVLERHGFTATVFAPTAYLGARNTWIEPTSCDVDIMDMDELRLLERRGISVESHGHDHIDFSEASEEAARRDIQRSREILAAGLSKEIAHFAFPYGRSSSRAQAIAQEQGLTAAYSIDARHGGRFAWERVQVTPLDGRRLFALKCSGLYHLMRRSRAGERAFSLVRPVARVFR